MSTRYPGGVISSVAPVPTGGGAQDSAPGVWTLDQADQYIATQEWPGTGTPDPQFQYVTALLHGDGTNGGQNNTFLDSSSNNFTITRNGNTTQGSFSPYGDLWSVANTTGSYLSLPSAVIPTSGSATWTVEGFVYPTSTTGNIVFVSQATSGSPNRFAIYVFDNNTINVAFANTTVVTSTVAIPLNNWTHVAVTRNGSTFTIFINGVPSGTGTSSTAINNTATQLMAIFNGNTQEFKGSVSNLRINNTVLYTSAFTPPTTPLTAVSGTVLLTCQSNRFVDNSTNNFTLTPTGTPSVQRFSPFQNLATYTPARVGGSGYFDGAGDYLTAPNNAAFKPGSSDWTVECWVNVTSTGTSQYFYADCDSSTNNGVLTLYINSTGNLNSDYWTSSTAVTTRTTTATVPYNQWSHVCASKIGTTLYLGINGVLQSFVAAATYQSPATIFPTIGRLGNFNSLFVNGYISNFRYVNGTAIYSGSTYTVPTAPLTNITNTSLLTNFTNGAIFDSDATNVLETVGNAQISTSVVKYGTGSMAFDGSGDGLRPNNQQNFTFGTGNFTIEFWVYLNTSSQSCAIYDSRPTSTSGLYPTIRVDSGVLYYYTNTGNRITGPTLAASTWYYVAVSRVGGTTAMFVNGNQVGTYADTNNYLNGANRPLIGADGYDNFSGTNYLNGYIDDLRVTVGYARYWYNFQAPTAPFPNYGGVLAPPVQDPLFDYNTLLLNGDGTNGAQNNTFLDSSTNNFTITRNGNTTQGSFSPYGPNWSVGAFGSSSSYLQMGSNAGLQLGTGDFTVECWAYFTTVGTPSASENVILDFRPIGTQGAFPDLSLSNQRLIWGVNSSAGITSGTVPLHTWLHIAIVRNSGSTRLYVNGNQSGSTFTDSVNYSCGSNNRIGNLSFFSNGERQFAGNISNLRIVKGSAVYTSTFTPPTSALTAISGTTLLACQANRFIDSSSSAIPITLNGSAAVQRFSPFNPTASYDTSVIGGSGYFDGAGDYLTTPSVTALNLFNTTNTVECWFFPLSFSTDTQIYGSNFDGTDYNRWRLTDTNGYPDYLSRFGTQITGSTGARLNQWNHIAFGRSGSTMSIWLNGVRVANATISSESPWGTGNIIVGGFETSGRANGYMSNLRVVKGTDVYGVSNTTITVPTSPVTAIANTAFLLNSTNAGIPDLAMQNNLETVGNAQVSTSVVKYGTGSLYFDGTGDYLFINNQIGFPTNAPFTLELWFYQNASGNASIFCKGGGAGSWSTTNGHQFLLFIESGNFYWMWNNAGSNTQITTTPPPINTWTHVAVTYDGTTTRLFFNGNIVGTSTTGYTLPTTRNRVTVGVNPDLSTYPLNGYIDDLRFTQGIARYVQPFTPPTQALQTF